MGSSSPQPLLNSSVVPASGTQESFDGLSTKKAIALLVSIFVLCLTILGLVYLSFPKLDSQDSIHLKFPSDIEEAKQLGIILSKYKDQYYAQVLMGVFVTYIFLQTFAIPGSIFLSIITGFLFSFPVALTLVCLCSATGASFCYLLSYLIGRPLIMKFLPDKLEAWRLQVEGNKNDLLSYIIFLRITPILPNWFINIVSPVLGVNLVIFWLGTFVGVAPPSFIVIQAGTTLQQLTSTTDAITFTSVFLLVAFAIISIIPVIYNHRTKQKVEDPKRR